MNALLDILRCALMIVGLAFLVGLATYLAHGFGRDDA